MVLPVHDVHPTHRTPWVTRFLLLANVVAFVLSPVALAPVLLTGAGLMLRNFMAMFQVDAGIDARLRTLAAYALDFAEEADAHLTLLHAIEMRQRHRMHSRTNVMHVFRLKQLHGA